MKAKQSPACTDAIRRLVKRGLENKGRPHLSTPRALALSESPPPSQNETCKRIRRNGSPRGVTHSIGAQASALSVK